MATKTAARPRLKNLDDLFMLNGGVNPLDVPAPVEQQPAKRYQSTLAIASLSPFRKHPFRLYEGERLDDMVESIKQHGVLVPILVRRLGEILEILSGHNRVNAARLAGLDRVPAIILENVSDADAWVYVIETNLMQRSFADMSHSEKAAVIAAHHSKLFSQGKRNDIIAELQKLEKPHDYGENGTSVEISQKSDTREMLAKEYGLKPFHVAQYLRVFRLVTQLKMRLDNGQFAITSAVALSFLTETEQCQLDQCIELNCYKVDGKKADLLREYSEKGKLSEDKIFLILSGELGKKPQPNRAPTVKVDRKVYAQYFRPDQPAKEVQDIVEKALALYFSQTA
nr:ParB N-terminal domain-containing protein [uncultured Eisenbergiella sp.]